MQIDGTAQWIMMGVATQRGVRVYASRELTRADIPAADYSKTREDPLITMAATGRNVLIIDGPDYPTVMAQIQGIWMRNPLPNLDASPGWTRQESGKAQRAERLEAERADRRRALAERMLPRLPQPGDVVYVQLDTGYPDQVSGTGYSRGGEPAQVQPASRPIPLERALNPVLRRQPLAIEAPKDGDGDG